MSKHSVLSSFAPTAAAVVIAVHRPHGSPRGRGARGGRARRAGDQLARAAFGSNGRRYPNGRPRCGDAEADSGPLDQVRTV